MTAFESGLNKIKFTEIKYVHLVDYLKWAFYLFNLNKYVLWSQS